MRIRTARPADAPAIAAVHVAGWRHAYRGRMPDALLDGLSVGARAAQWTKWLAAGSTTRCRVAEVDGAIIGFASIGPARDLDGIGELYAIYLNPERIGTGAGRALLADAAAGLRAQGFTEAVLWVLRDNLRARAVYAAAGWCDDGGRKSAAFGGRLLEEVRYRLRLPMNS